MKQQIREEDRPRVRELFEAALAAPAPERRAWLSAACADEAVRAYVEKLLNAHARVDGFLETPCFGVTPVDEDEVSAIVGRRIGPYLLLRELGQGGMSTVYLATRDNAAYDQQVAIKVVWPGLRSRHLWRRFRQEQQILASLDHPHIARLLDGGTTEDGWPYLVMEYVAGEPINIYCAERKLPIVARLRLLQDVCAAVEYAHAQGVIHRDLKPNNILVTHEGIVKLLDFGIAKLMTPDPHATAATLTLTALHPMTPDYASPEQIRGDELTPASDVYSLGVILYELLTGERPYRFKSPLPHEITRAICEVEPDAPSRRVAQLARTRAIFVAEAPDKLRRELKGDLDNITLTALAKAPAQRYQSPAALAADIARHLNRQAVTARGNNPLYRASKRVRRHKALTALAAFILLAGLVALGWWRATAPARRAAAQHAAYAATIDRAALALAMGRSDECAQLLPGCAPAPGTEDLRGFEWYYLWRRSHQSQHTLPHSAAVLEAAFVLDGERILTNGPLESFHLWDSATGYLVDTWQTGKTPNYPTSHEKRERMLITDGDGIGWLKDFRTGRLTRAFAGSLGVMTAGSVFPDEQRLAVGHEDGTIALWTLGAEQPFRTLRGAPGLINYLLVSATGQRILTQVNNELIQLWDVSAGRVLATYRERVGAAVRFSFDGRYFWTIADGRRLTVREAATGRTVAALPDVNSSFQGAQLVRADLLCAEAQGILTCFSFPTLKEQFAFNLSRSVFLAAQLSPDGKLLAATSGDGGLLLRDFATKRLLADVREHSQPVWHFNFSADSRKLVTAGDDHLAKVWDIAQLTAPPVLEGHKGKVFSVAFAPDGRSLVSASSDRTIKLWGVQTGNVLREFTGHEDQILCVAFSPDGHRLASSGADGTVRVWDVATGRLLLTLKHPLQIHSVAFSPDGRLLATGCDDHKIRLFDALTGRALRTLAGHSKEVWSVAFAPDGRTLASGSVDRTVKLWNVTTGRETATLTGHDDWVWSVVFSPDGKLLATGSSDRTVKLWDLATRQPLRTFTGHTDEVFEVAFTPDGQRLATASNDKSVKIWDVATARPLLTFNEHSNEVWSVAFSPDGQMLASGSWDETIHLWRAASKEEVKAQSQK